MRKIVAGLCAGLAVAATVAVDNSGAAKQGLQILCAFNGADGRYPSGALMEDSKGNLYGTTYEGGQNGLGAVFRIAPDGTETLLHSFPAFSIDGKSPGDAVIEDAAGNIYGTTSAGGTNYYGTVFKIAPDGTETILHNFDRASDGASPLGLVMDAAGNLYGPATTGGAAGGGTIFKLAPDGTFSVLHAFGAGSGGMVPNDLMIDASGNLFGTTAFGGSGCGSNGCGVAYKLAADGTQAVLYTFRGKHDGWEPLSALIADAEGNLFGTTTNGGENEKGTIFEITTGGSELILHSFAGQSDGSRPAAGLLADGAGSFYGTTPMGGPTHHGAIYKLAPDGTETVLHSFSLRHGGGQGAVPAGSLIADKKGRLFGATIEGGAGYGTVFSLKE